MGLRTSSGLVAKGLVAYYDASNLLNFTLNEVEVLVVAGGGGGGANHAGGGGAGGLLYSNSYRVTPGTPITVTVGNGGAAAPVSNGPSASNGGDSVFGVITATGGGGGGNRNDSTATSPGRNGGSGGGGGGAQTTLSASWAPGTGISGQGNNGGTAVDIYGGGGGGAGGPGYDGYPTGNLNSGNGGIGLAFSISGVTRYYSGGGGAGYGNNVGGGIGGLGGGGNGGVLSGENGTPGASNTGGGGGGGGAGGTAGSAGGSGVVIVRYPGPQKATGGNTITNVNGYTIHTFTSSGTFTPLSAAAPSNGGTAYGYANLISQNYSATSVGSPTWTTSNSGSVVFNGTGDRLICGPISGSFREFSVLVWFYPTSIANYRNVIDCNFAFNPITGNVGPRLEIDSTGRLGWIFSGRTDTNDVSDSSVVVASGLAANTWHFAGITRSANQTTTTYYNGSPVSVNAANPNGFVDVFSNIAIGRGFHLSSDAERSFAGRIPIVLIYNRALSSSEISQNYNFHRGRFGI